jgi:RND superfamily putative drug exporter
MSEFLARVARALTHHWLRGLISAIVVLFLLGAIAANSTPAVDDFSAPGTETQQAIDLFRAHSPALAGADSTLVYRVEQGKLSDPGPKAAIQEALAKVAKLEGVAQVADPFAEGAAVSPDGRIAAVDVRYTTDPSLIDKEDGEALLEAGKPAEGSGVEFAARGMLVDFASEQEAPIGELVGIAIAIVLLTLLFRSLVAMIATLVGALLGVMVGQLVLAILSKPLGLPSFASVIAVMLGLGAGIDYALLIIGRYREQIVAGDSRRDASAKSAATSGASVVAAGR